jgi:hypothetical protein
MMHAKRSPVRFAPFEIGGDELSKSRFSAGTALPVVSDALLM